MCFYCNSRSFFTFVTDVMNEEVIAHFREIMTQIEPKLRVTQERSAGLTLLYLWDEDWDLVSL